MDGLGTPEVVALLARLRAVMEAERDALIALDGQVGDSDLGLTMAKAFAAAAELAAAPASAAEPPGKLLAKAGVAMAKAAPSTMGTLLATGFMRGGKAVEGAARLGTPELRRFWEAFLGGILERGKARRGEKTVVDALAPAVEALAAADAAGSPLPAALDAAARGAAEGLEATKAMVAQHGKAACFGERTRGLPDAGATVGALLVSTMHRFVTEGGAGT